VHIEAAEGKSIRFHSVDYQFNLPRRREKSSASFAPVYLFHFFFDFPVIILDRPQSSISINQKGKQKETTI